MRRSQTFYEDLKKDAKGEARLKESRGGGTSTSDEGAYQLIMRDKERLLSLDTKLKFIFSGRSNSIFIG